MKCSAGCGFAALCVLLVAGSASAGVAFSDPVVNSDPTGDTFPGSAAGVIHDIVSIESRLGGGLVEFRVRFNAPIAAPSDFASPNNLTGFLDLDVDQNPATGATSQKTLFSPVGPSSLGAEFYVDLFSEAFQPGLADLVDTMTGFSSGTVAVSFNDDLLTILVELAVLSNDDGAIDYGVIVGDFIDNTDEARNPGLPVLTTVVPMTPSPEPTAVATWVVVALVGGWYSRTTRSRLRRDTTRSLP